MYTCLGPSSHQVAQTTLFEKQQMIFKRKRRCRNSQILRNNFNVDDYLRSEQDENAAIERIESVTRMCAPGGFRLTKFTSNKRRVLEAIHEEERSKELNCNDLSCDYLPIQRALGVQWFRRIG